MGMVDSQSCSSNNQANGWYQRWERRRGGITWWTPFLLTTRCSAIKVEKQETYLSLFLLICLINLWSFSHLCTHDICRQVKPKLCRTKNLMLSAPTLGLGWRRRVFFLARLKGRNIFGLCFFLLNCVILDLGSILSEEGLVSLPLPLSLATSFPRLWSPSWQGL